MIFLVFLLPVLVLGQNRGESTYPKSLGTIKGTVYDSESGERLPYVNLQLSYKRVGVATDEKGAFQFLDIPAGTYSIKASFIGYKDREIGNVVIEQGHQLELDIHLEPAFLLSEEVVVTAARKKQSLAMTPASIGLVTEKSLSQKNVTTFDQAFQEIPGIQVTRSSGANIQAFSIRGASEVAGGGIGNRVLLLVDGRPSLSPESGGALWNLVPMNAINRIEVIKGAYSSLFGSSAMGGVVNVITRTPTEEPETRAHINYGFYSKAPDYTGYSRFNDFYRAELSHSRSIGNFSYLVDGGIKSNDGHKENAAFRQVNLYGKGKYDFARNRHVVLSFNYNDIHNDSPASWISRRYAYTVAEHKKDDLQERSEYNADLYYYALTSGKLKYSSRFYYYLNTSDFYFNDDPDNDTTNVNTGKQFVDEENVHARRIGNISQIDYFHNSRHYFIVGTDIKLDRIEGLPDSILYGEHDAFSFGTYLQDEITFSDRLIATLGVRYDYYEIRDEYQGHNLSPKLALVYKINERFAVRSLFAQAFRDPSISERFIKFAQGSGLRFRPNPGLKPERLLFSGEVGTKFKIGKNLNIDFALFYNKYKNLISFNQVSAPGEPLTFEVINLKSSVMQGAEISLQYGKAGVFDLSASYTFLDAKDISSNRLNDELAYKIRNSASFSANGYYKDFSLNINGRYNDAVEEVFLYPGSEPDAYAILNSKLAYNFSEDLSVYLAIDNITNTQYEELERYRMPGRSFLSGVQLKF